MAVTIGTVVVVVVENDAASGTNEQFEEISED